MTNQELIDYYANLLIIQYIGQPKAYAEVQATVAPVIADQLPLAVQEAFTLGTAIGTQLDIIGKYVGASRNGFNFSGAVVLSDDEYTSLIFLKIIQNYYGSSLSDIQDLIAQFFPGELFVFDYKNMQLSYYISRDGFSEALAEFFVSNGYLPKPMSVQLGSLIGNFSTWRAALIPPGPSPVDLTTFFGMCSYEIPTPQNVTGFNCVAGYSMINYDMNSPWLAYEDAVA